MRRPGARVRTAASFGRGAAGIPPMMRWIPLVTLLQVGLDMAVVVGVPGYGHDYVAAHTIPAWAAVAEPEGWTAEREAALVRLFADRPSR